MLLFFNVLKQEVSSAAGTDPRWPRPRLSFGALDAHARSTIGPRYASLFARGGPLAHPKLRAPAREHAQSAKIRQRVRQDAHLRGPW